MSAAARPAGPMRQRVGVDGRVGPLACALVVLLAFLVREYFVLVGVVDIPIRGDIREYVLYAWNLHYHHVFGMSPPDAVVAVPDAYRSPGYPWLLALCMALRPSGSGWYALALQMQVLLGTATVWLTMLLGRRWLGWGWAILAGALLAFWPHHVAATGALLSEVLFGWTLMAGLLAFAVASEGHRMGVVLAAIAFGFAYLVNPLIALFPAVLSVLLWRNGRPHSALLFLGIFLVPVLAFAVRNLALPAQPGVAHTGRAAMNFVQGSWPQYHDAWHAQQQGDPVAIAIMDTMSREIAIMDHQPLTGVRQIAARVTVDPAYYAAWYLVRKPFLLWDWDIRIGYGGPYVLDVRNSPLEHHALLAAIGEALRTINPLLTALLFAASAGLLVGGWRRSRWAPPAAVATAALALYLTAVHDVFQAEPRYATAYRGIEALLVATALQAIMHWVTKRVTK